jgi:ribosomal protein S12 methylthiotransferase
MCGTGRTNSIKPAAPEIKDPKRPVRVGLISLGCAKNLVDAEIMLGSLLKSGVEVTNDAAQADVVIVNTCSFIDAAQEESVDAILQSDELRIAKNRGQGLIVSGCLPQRFREDLPKLLPEVDAFMGIDQVGEVASIVDEAMRRRSEKLSRPPSEKSKATARTNPTKVRKELARLDIGAPEDDASASLRGTGRFGNTRKILTPPEPLIARSNGPLVSVHERPSFIPDFGTPRFRLTPAHFAYLKIAEGCNHPCSFCIIPRMRGTHRSRTQTDIVSEARQLIAEGVKEINLISQDSTYYGLDLRENHSRAIASPERFGAAVKALPGESTTICSLLRALNDLPGDFWIRLLYTHPAHWTDDLIKTIADCSKVARYVDIPLQHIHENMLERMRRETSRDYIVDLIRRIRAGVPGIALRTTFIVGFPGETEEYFESLLEFITETRFERLGVFAYSQEEGTRAGKMAGQVPEKVRQKRRARAMASQHSVATQISQSFVGRTLKVLVEKASSQKEILGARVQSWEHGLMRDQKTQSRMVGPTSAFQNGAAAAGLKGTWMTARGEADAPDIDGRIYVRGPLTPSEFAQVKIVGHTDYDLVAEPI